MDGRLKLKDNLIITSLDGEGLLFDMDTKRTFWYNETAAFLLELFKKGNSLSFIENSLREVYTNHDESKITQDVISFTTQLKQYELVSLQMGYKEQEAEIKKFGSERIKKLYVKPIIEEEKIVPEPCDVGGGVRGVYTPRQAARPYYSQ